MVRWIVLFFFTTFCSVELPAQGDLIQPERANWTWSLGDSDGNLWLHCGLNGEPEFSYRIGAGGAITELHDRRVKGLNLLPPSFRGERTDRIVQWTAWSDDVVHKVRKLDRSEWRFNITQGGTFDGTPSPVMDVRIDGPRSCIDIWSVPQDQWKKEQQKFIRCQFSALTRYELFDAGVIRCTRLIRVGHCSVKNQKEEFGHLYLEGWTPFRKSAEAMDAIALGLDEQALPVRVSAAGPAFPHYPGWDVGKTNGYALVFNQGKRMHGAVFAVAFGKKGGESSKEPCDHRLNAMQWDDGLAVLPACTFRNVPTGAYLRQTLFFVARHGFSHELKSLIEELVQNTPPPQIYLPDEIEMSDVRPFQAILEEQTRVEGSRTEKLWPLVKFIQ